MQTSFRSAEQIQDKIQKSKHLKAQVRKRYTIEEAEINFKIMHALKQELFAVGLHPGKDFIELTYALRHYICQSAPVAATHLDLWIIERNLDLVES